MSKSTKYIVAIVGLLIINLILFFTGSDTKKPGGEKYFDSQDLDGISRVIFIREGDTTKIEQSEQGWTLNDQYKADNGFVNTLISVLERVETGRTIENWNQEILGSAEVEFDFNSRYRFQFATNPTKTKSYFISDGEAKEVAVPGYRDNVVDIFTLHPDQWRDRMVMDGSWRTIQNVSVSSQNNEDFQISFQNDFFVVNGNDPTDSSAVINYLNQFQQFQANEMISKGRFPELDSLAKLDPLAVVTIDDIKLDEPVQFTVYPNQEGQPFHLVLDSKEQRMVIDSRRINQILTNPDNLN